MRIGLTRVRHSKERTCAKEHTSSSKQLSAPIPEEIYRRERPCELRTAKRLPHSLRQPCRFFEPYGVKRYRQHGSRVRPKSQRQPIGLALSILSDWTTII